MTNNSFSQKFPLVTSDQFTNLQKSLLYLNISELKACCNSLKIPESSTKLLLINRILQYLKDGTLIKVSTIPIASRAQKNKKYPLQPDTSMVKGAYKNDLKTRLFFKKLIGNYFHFTAFGIDWLNQRWIGGNPPTYQEFATMWQQEYEKRKKEKVGPKQEWHILILFKISLNNTQMHQKILFKTHGNKNNINISPL